MLRTAASRVHPLPTPFFLVLDFEATCIRDAKIQPCSVCHLLCRRVLSQRSLQEIIEFPVSKLNARSMQVESTFHRYVRPTRQPQLTDFCTELTGITQGIVDDSNDLPFVLAEFDTWLNQEELLRTEHPSFTFVTCGDWDLGIALPQEASHKGIELPSSVFCTNFFGSKITYFERWVNVKKTFTQHTGSFPRSMAVLLNKMQIKHQGRLHSGKDDVANIVEITKWFIKNGVPLTPTNVFNSHRTFGARFAAPSRTSTDE